MKHTKIVASISDNRCEVDFIRTLYESGMNVVRMNTAHASFEGMTRVIENVRKVSKSIALLMDTKGPEIRTTACKEPIELKRGQKIDLTGDPDQMTTSELICVSYPNFYEELEIGTIVLFDDGEIELKILSKSDGRLHCQARNNGALGSRKSVNVPGVRINLPSLTKRDITNIKFAIEHELDFIAHSFVRSAQDVRDIQAVLDQEDSPIKIIAKIENQEGVERIDEILEEAYGVMVARGDLGIEIAQEKIPGIQRLLIRKCVEAKKPVIIATQMLHSMIKYPRPTRAEVADIANAIYCRTDALMLSGETAYGDYPVESVQTMARIAEEAEITKLGLNDIEVPFSENDGEVTAFLAKQAARSAVRIHTKAIVTDSFSGRTARFLSAFRGKVPVYAQCYLERTARELALSYGVISTYHPITETAHEYLTYSVRWLLKEGLIEEDDLIAYLGASFGLGGGAKSLAFSIARDVVNE
jgi:pyruvate kinase